jgi:DnaJ-class molecular chaperone
MGKRKQCVFCWGSGKRSVPADGTCPECMGNKTITVEYGRTPDQIMCYGCKGEGKCKGNEIDCSVCDGTGKEKYYS